MCWGSKICLESLNMLMLSLHAGVGVLWSWCSDNCSEQSLEQVALRILKHCCVAGVPIIAQSNFQNTTPYMQKLFQYLSVQNFVQYSMSQTQKGFTKITEKELQLWSQTQIETFCQDIHYPTIWSLVSEIDIQRLDQNPNLTFYQFISYKNNSYREGPCVVVVYAQYCKYL